MGFVLAAAILAVLILGILTFPWWRWHARKTPAPMSGEQLAAELSDDVATGLLATEDLKPASRDLQTDSADEAASGAGPGRPRWTWRVAGLLLVPLAAGVLYLHFGNWRAGLFGDQAASVHQLKLSLQRLKAHLDAHPDDTQGWLDLGQGEEALGRYGDAAEAYGQVAALESQPDPDVLALWGEAQILADPQQVTEQERRLFGRVLALDPNNPRGLWYGGLIALSSGDRAVARKDWQRLLEQPGVPPPVAALVRSHLGMIGAGTADATSSGSAEAPAPAARRLAVSVSLKPALAGHFTPGETLFVFARGASGGPPVAVRKIRVRRFPVTVTLDDSNAMVAGRDLSSISGPIDIVARLSRSGTASPEPGDLQGVQAVGRLGRSTRLTLTLDRVVGDTAAQPSATPSPGS